MNITSVFTTYYNNFAALRLRKNKAKASPIQSQSVGCHGKQSAREVRIIGKEQKDRLFGIDY
jgi:hypothetical protein